MIVNVLREAGYDEAMLGLTLSYDQPIGKAPLIARKLLKRGGSHVKFLESICVWIDITAPRYWWQQFDAYRIGVTKQSESTMHTITWRPLTQADFIYPIYPATLRRLNRLIAAGDLEQIKAELPEGFLQRRVVRLSYKVLRHIYWQRRNHRLREWHFFIEDVLEQLDFPEFITTESSEG